MNILGHNFIKLYNKSVDWYICSKCKIKYYDGEFVKCFYEKWPINDISCDEVIIKSIIE